jgi:hypothetical protein
MAMAKSTAKAVAPVVVRVDEERERTQPEAPAPTLHGAPPPPPSTKSAKKVTHWAPYFPMSELVNIHTACHTASCPPGGTDRCTCPAIC